MIVTLTIAVDGTDVLYSWSDDPHNDGVEAGVDLINRVVEAVAIKLKDSTAKVEGRIKEALSQGL